MEGGTEAGEVGGKVRWARKSLPPARDGRYARGEPNFTRLHGLFNPARPESGPGRSLNWGSSAAPSRHLFSPGGSMSAACGRGERRGEEGRRVGEEPSVPVSSLFSFFVSLVGTNYCCSGYKEDRDVGVFSARVVGYCDLATLTRKERWFRCMCWGGSRGGDGGGVCWPAHPWDGRGVRDPGGVLLWPVPRTRKQVMARSLATRASGSAKKPVE